MHGTHSCSGYDVVGESRFKSFDRKNKEARVSDLALSRKEKNKC